VRALRNSAAELRAQRGEAGAKHQNPPPRLLIYKSIN
jgi:hypothetical protein